MTRAELRTAVQAYGWFTDTAAVQDAFIQEATRQIESDEWWMFRRTTASGVTVAGTSTVAVPATVDPRVDGVRIAFGTDYVEGLTEIEEPRIRRLLHEDRQTGTPEYWSRSADNILLWPIPDKVYTVTFEGYIEPKALSADGDSPNIPPRFHDTVVYWTVRQLALRERDYGLADRMQVQLDRALASLRRADKQERAKPNEVLPRTDELRLPYAVLGF